MYSASLSSYPTPRQKAAASFSTDYSAGGMYSINSNWREKRKNKKPEAAYWIPQYCPVCFVLVLLKSTFWLLALLLKAQQILFKLQEVANLTRFTFPVKNSNSKGTSLSVAHEAGDAHLPAGRSLPWLNISAVPHIDSAFTHSWSPIAYAVPPVSLSQQTFRESGTPHETTNQRQRAFLSSGAPARTGNSTKQKVALLFSCRHILLLAGSKGYQNSGEVVSLCDSYSEVRLLRRPLWVCSRCGSSILHLSHSKTQVKSLLLV